MAQTEIIARLAGAEKAYDELMTGRSVRVFVDQNGERVEYATANAAKLQIYIRSLRAQLGGYQRPTGPMGVIF